jgi:hypothetical protein
MRTRMMVSLLAAAALALPASAIADHGGGDGGGNSGSGHGGHGGHGHGVRLDTYKLKGTLSAYTAAMGTTPGSITIKVLKGNRAGRPFVGMTLTFVLTTATKIEPRGAVILDGDRGWVQLKAAEGLDAAALQAATPKEVEDEFDDD